MGFAQPACYLDGLRDQIACRLCGVLAALLPCRVDVCRNYATEHADFGSSLAMFMSLYVAMRAAVADTRAPGAWPNHSMLGIVWCVTL